MTGTGMDWPGFALVMLRQVAMWLPWAVALAILAGATATLFRRAPRILALAWAGVAILLAALGLDLVFRGAQYVYVVATWSADLDLIEWSWRVETFLRSLAFAVGFALFLGATFLGRTPRSD